MASPEHVVPSLPGPLILLSSTCALGESAPPSEPQRMGSECLDREKPFRRPRSPPFSSSSTALSARALHHPKPQRMARECLARKKPFRRPGLLHSPPHPPALSARALHHPNRRGWAGNSFPGKNRFVGPGLLHSPPHPLRSRRERSTIRTAEDGQRMTGPGKAISSSPVSSILLLIHLRSRRERSTLLILQPLNS